MALPRQVFLFFSYFYFLLLRKTFSYAIVTVVTEKDVRREKFEKYIQSHNMATKNGQDSKVVCRRMHRKEATNDVTI